jgi:ribosomal protein L7/L12
VNDLLLVLLVAAVIVGVLYFVRTRPNAGEVATDKASGASRILSQPVDPRVLSVVVALLSRSQKVNAIRQLMQATGLGLADARKLAEAIQTGHRPPANVIKGEATDVSGSAGAGSGRRAGVPGGSDLAERAKGLREQGREVEAVQLVCDETGMGLTEARQFVRALN